MNVPDELIRLGWNTRQLTYADFENLCVRLNVVVQRVKMKTKGMYFVCEGRPFISLSSKLHGVELWLVAWHEMVHHLLHPPGLRCFTRGTVNKIEREAQSVALCAVIDENTLFNIVAHGELHDFPASMIDARMAVTLKQMR